MVSNEKSGNPGVPGRMDSLPRIVIEDPIFFEYDAQELRFQIRAQEASYFEQEKRVVLSSVQGEFRGEDRSLWQLEGAKGEIDMVDSDMEIKGGVRMWSQEGMELRTESVFYRSSDRVVEAPGHVKWSGEQWTSESEGAIIRLLSKEWSLPKDVHAQIHGEPGDS